MLTRWIGMKQAFSSLRVAERRSENTCFIIVILACLLLSSCTSTPSYLSAAKQIPIQHNGRIKSFEAFSRSTVQWITGKQTWQKKQAVQVVLDALAHRETIKDIEWIHVNYAELRQTLGLAKEKTFFSVNQIIPSVDKVVVLVQHSQAKRDKDVRPTKLEQKAEELYSQLMTVQRLESGENITVAPSLDETTPWQSPYVTAENGKWEMGNGNFENLIQFYAQGNFPQFNQAVGQWEEKVAVIVSPATRTRISLEKYYYDIQPFEWSWILYLLAFIFLTFFASSPPHPGVPTQWVGRSPLGGEGKGEGGNLWRWLGILFLTGAVLFHTLGIALRVIILARPPVSNMYESMIYMNWILMVFAVIFAIAQKTSLPVAVGSLTSALVMLYAHLLPLDSSMDVLVPVLRSNYWLTIHVMTIVSSYGAFGLAMALGHRHLFLSARMKFTPQAESDSSQLIYQVMQVGILLIGIGTVLGGVWANESWGRFWGWDPKETWALITFLGYLVIVHSKHAKWLDNFGLAVGSVLGFLLVLMTWYGVNFVLGRGLHSYGFGSGGIVWIIYYLIAETIFVSWVILSRLRAKNCAGKVDQWNRDC